MPCKGKGWNGLGSHPGHGETPGEGGGTLTCTQLVMYGEAQHKPSEPCCEDRAAQEAVSSSGSIRELVEVSACSPKAILLPSDSQALPCPRPAWALQPQPLTLSHPQQPHHEEITLERQQSKAPVPAGLFQGCHSLQRSKQRTLGTGDGQPCFNGRSQSSTIQPQGTVPRF